MGQVFGKRWEIIGDKHFGEGGQGHVYRVKDRLAPTSGEFALKKIQNRTRRDRFIREVEAVKRLDHPNIIRLLDHSALEDDAGSSEDKDYLVMPIAKGGDLSDTKRLTLYKGSIEAVVTVAKLLASALHAAHQQGIIHRDVKPANVLFSGLGHDVWVADFGICLIRDQPRLTETDRVMGPAYFMAPEMESGRVLDVQPAADIYSLGKLLYYMFSGGTILPRERLRDPEFSSIFGVGGRHHILQSLLERMICPLSERLTSMEQVSDYLIKIENWEQTARALPLSISGIKQISSLQTFARAQLTARDELQTAIEKAKRRLKEAEEGILEWLQAELEQVRSELMSAENMDARTDILHNSAAAFPLPSLGGCYYYRLKSISLSFAVKGALAAHGQFCELHLCIEKKEDDLYESDESDRVSDQQLALIPLFYQGVLYAGRQNFIHFPVRSPKVGLPVSINNGSEVPLDKTTLIFDPEINDHYRLKASDWPFALEDLKSSLTTYLDLFIMLAEQNMTGNLF